MFLRHLVAWPWQGTVTLFTCDEKPKTAVRRLRWGLRRDTDTDTDTLLKFKQQSCMNSDWRYKDTCIPKEKEKKHTTITNYCVCVIVFGNTYSLYGQGRFLAIAGGPCLKPTRHCTVLQMSWRRWCVTTFTTDSDCTSIATELHVYVSLWQS